MCTKWFVCLLLTGLAYTQAADPAPLAAKPPVTKAKADADAKSAAETNIGPTDPVITVKGPCTDPAKKDDKCETVITREQFESLANALQPNMSPPIKIRLATAYSKLIGMSNEAQQRGLDKTPKFDASMGFAKMQILSQQLNGILQEESNKVSDEEIEQYYD